MVIFQAITCHMLGMAGPSSTLLLPSRFTLSQSYEILLICPPSQNVGHELNHKGLAWLCILSLGKCGAAQHVTFHKWHGLPVCSALCFEGCPSSHRLPAGAPHSGPSSSDSKIAGRMLAAFVCIGSFLQRYFELVAGRSPKRLCCCNMLCTPMRTFSGFDGFFPLAVL